MIVTVLYYTVLRIYPQFPLFLARCQLESHDVLNVCVRVGCVCTGDDLSLSTVLGVMKPISRVGTFKQTKG